MICVGLILIFLGGIMLSISSMNLHDTPIVTGEASYSGRDRDNMDLVIGIVLIGLGFILVLGTSRVRRS